MNDPHALPDRPKTRRAPALQPDRPGGGDTPDDDTSSGIDDERTTERQRSQSETALDNVRDGYR